MSNRTIYLRVCIVEEIPTRKIGADVEETIAGFEIEFEDLRDARKALLKVSDELDGLQQEDIMDDGSQDDRDDDDEEDEDVDALLQNVVDRGKKILRKKLR